MEWPADKVERWPIAKLIPYARNARTHTEEQIAEIAGSIRQWGWTMPVLFDEDGTIIAGHGRILAAHKLELTDVPGMVARGWSVAQKQAYRLADNKLTLNAGWDAALLRIELADLAEMGFDLRLAGFSGIELDELLLQRDDAADGRGIGNLAERFGIPPFSVLNAREGWWQERKNAWIALGIQSELGRGEGVANAVPGGGPMPLDRAKAKRAHRANATPGGSAKPAADYRKRQRGDERERAIDAAQG